MRTPDTVGAINHISTPFNNPIASALRTATASTLRLNLKCSIVPWTSEDGETNDGKQLPTFDVCSRAIMTAAERMAALSGQPYSLAVAIAYDECLDIVTAAMEHMAPIELQGIVPETMHEVYQAMRKIHELLRPNPPVRRALQF